MEAGGDNVEAGGDNQVYYTMMTGHNQQSRPRLPGDFTILLFQDTLLYLPLCDICELLYFMNQMDKFCI